MEKYIYIKRSITKRYASFERPLSSEEYNNLGETWQDYLNNKWVLLSEDQVEFLEQNPNASVKEVWNKELDPQSQPHIPTEEELLEEAKLNKISDIDEYDQSENVNSFSILGNNMWLTREDRTQIDESINAYQGMGQTEMTKFFNGIPYTFPIATWRQMLNALIVYASEALNVTEAHKAAVNSLTTIEEVEAYDITSGYPNKLEF